MGEDRVPREDWDFPGREGFGPDALRAAAFHQLPFFIQVFHGPDHWNVAENAASVELYSGSSVGGSIRSQMVAAEGQGLVEMFDRVYRTGDRVVARGARFVIISPGGSEREMFLDTEFLPLRDTDDGIVGVLAIGRDVGEQLRAEREQPAAAAELSRKYRRATDVVEEVQRALLPARLPALLSFDVAAGYVVGGAEQAAGGDWFEVVPRPDGKAAVVVGDVVGHGVDAAAVMAQLRAVTLERLHAGVAVNQVVQALDHFVQIAPAGQNASICVAELDPVTGHLQYSSAGHPPPLVIDPNGDSFFLPPTGEPLIGSADPRTAWTHRLSSGQVLLLYSDGIIERPGLHPAAGTVALREIATAAVADTLIPAAFTLPSAVDRATIQTLERLTRETGVEDDITLLAIQPAAPLKPFTIDVQALRAEIPTVRTALRNWFRPGQVDPSMLDKLDQITTELCENSIDHAYPDQVGPLTVAATLDPAGLVTITVTDQGRWRPPPRLHEGRGLGLALTQQFADQLTVDGKDTGTTVTVTTRLWKQAHGRLPSPPQPRDGLFDAFVYEHPDHTTLTVYGPADTNAVEDLTAHLALGTTPGSQPFTIDLEQTTVLTSAVIHIIQRAVRRAAYAGVPTRIVCRPGSVAHQVLSLAGFNSLIASNTETSTADDPPS